MSEIAGGGLRGAIVALPRAVGCAARALRRSAPVAVGAFLALCAATAAAALELPLTDAEDGVTCDYHLAGVRAPWLHRGGDWVDAAGAEQGARPFAVATVANAGRGEMVALDLTTLVRQWHAHRRGAGFALLRAMRGASRGVVDFASRESDEAVRRPVLEVEWSDGSVARIAPSADASIDCTTRRSLGASRTIRVGGNTSTLLVFPLADAGARSVERATLTLAAVRQYGGATEVAAFQAMPPWARGSAPRAGLASRFPGDEGIVRHPAVIFAAGFDSGDWKSGWSTIGERSVAETVVRGEGNGFEPLDGNALRVTLTPKQNLGLDLRYEFAREGLPEPDEAYFRYYLRLGADWKPVRDGGKLPGFAGTYNRAGWGLREADGTNGWSARGAFFRQPANPSPAMVGHAGIGSYVYHPDVRGGDSEHWGWGLGPTGRLARNRWYSVEQYVKLNTPGRADGVFRAWIDGHLVIERNGIRFRDVPGLHIESVWFNVYHGGVARPASPMTLYIDNVVIAREYIGPMVR